MLACCQHKLDATDQLSRRTGTDGKSLPPQIFLVMKEEEPLKLYKLAL